MRAPAAYRTQPRAFALDESFVGRARIGVAAIVRR